MNTLIVLAWVGCGLPGYGLTFAYFQRAYPSLARRSYRSDMAFSAAMNLAGGPIATIVAILFVNYLSWRGPQGFKWL